MSSDLTNSKNLALFPAGELAMAGCDPEGDERNFRRNLLTLRDAFQRSPEIRECLTAATREERKQGILHFHPFAECAPGGKASLEKALDYLLEELEQMQVAEHPQYLVDESTGKAVAPFTKEMVYQTPDFVNEAGQLIKGKKVVNPSFASAIGLARQEQSRTESALARSSGDIDPVYLHLRDPDSIVRAAREHLEAAGVPEAEPGSVEEVLEVGREQSDGVLQSPNRGFHRHAVYGALVARKVVDAGHKACTVVGLEKKSNSKFRWYEVKVLVPARSADAGANVPTL